MAFPTTPILDDFNRANEDPLAGNWTQGFQSGTDGSAKIVSNRINWADGGSTGLAAHLYNTTPNADQEAYIDISERQAASYHTVLLHATNNSTGYEIAARTDENDVRVLKWDDSVTVSQVGLFSQTIADGDKVGASIVGNVGTVYYKSGAGAWASLGTFDASGYTSGKIGFRMGQNAGSFADNFGGGSIAGNNFTLTAATGTFTLTGENAGLKAGRKLTAGVGTFTLTGYPVALSGQLTAPRFVVGVSRETRTAYVSEE